MSLFIGNISKNVKMSDLMDEFDKYGKCEVKIKVRSASLIVLHKRPSAMEIDLATTSPSLLSCFFSHTFLPPSCCYDLLTPLLLIGVLRIYRV